MTPNQKYYYQLAGDNSLINENPAILFLKKLVKTNEKILDVGCGEGTRLATLVGDSHKGIGIDINNYAIRLAKDRYPNQKFIKYNGKKIPFNDNIFNVVYSVNVLEHVADPENFIHETIRVLRPNGYIIFTSPNFGAPYRRSPNSIEGKINKLLIGILSDFKYLFKQNEMLNWTKVIPKTHYCQPDDDATCEPYLFTLKKFLINNNISIQYCSSYWESIPLFSLTPHIFFTILGRFGFFPIKNWGPLIMLIGKKQKVQ